MQIVAVAVAGFCVLTWAFWPEPEGQGVAPRPPRDPRNPDDDAFVHAVPVAGARVDAGFDAVDAGDVVGDEDAFAVAMTGHTGAVYVGDLDDIRARGVLRVLARNNASSYFLYRGVERGFEYELAAMLAKRLGVRLQMVVAPTRRELIPWLLEGRGDIVFAGLSPKSPRADRVTFSPPYATVRWAVVTSTKPPPAPLSSPKTLPKKAKKAPAFALSEWQLLVQPSSSALPILRGNAVAGGLRINAALETDESEDLLDDVATGPPGVAAVVEERVARLELMHRRDLKIAALLDDVDAAAVATRVEDNALAAAVAAFVVDVVGSSDHAALDRRYHRDRAATAIAVNDAVRGDKEGRLTPFDDAMKAAAARVRVDDGVPLDWRLLAALAVQESGLDPNAESAFGAQGLMQLLPSTARENGCDDTGDPTCSVNAAARYLGRLAKRCAAPHVLTKKGVDGGVSDVDVGDRVVSLQDQVRFALAAYNAGIAHVDDARALAAAEGKDPDRWFGHVEVAMSNLEKPRLYARTKYGFARGSETVAFVSSVQSRFDVFASLVD